LFELNSKRIIQLAIQWGGQLLLASLALAVIAAASKR